MPTRTAVATAVSAVFCLVSGAVVPASAAPSTIPYDPAIGESTTLNVRYLRVTANDRRPDPVVSVDYELELRVTERQDDRFLAEVRNQRTNVTVNRQRVLAPPDFDSLLLLAIDGMTAELEMTDQGALVSVSNWDNLRQPLIDKAVRLAGDDETLVETARTFLPDIDAESAVQVFARPLVISAPGRMVAFDPPERRAAEARDAAIPGFANARGRWSFDLLPRSPLPDSVTVQWLGVPATESLRAVLEPLRDRLARINPDNDDTLATIEADGRMWQRFSATYDDETGQLLAFQGAMELTAGPLQRRVAIEAAAMGR
ncbi:hypothetical protein [Bauldia sp.]|uniref:hypothetical protein n=1 Tax=Bauldia sp. TaxID=2575872 RepID=UPI003BACB87D